MSIDRRLPNSHSMGRAGRIVLTLVRAAALLVLVVSLTFLVTTGSESADYFDLRDDVLIFDAKIPGEAFPSIYMTSGTQDRFLRLTDGLTSDRVPELSRDGEWVTFVSTRSGNEDIFVMRVDGSSMRQLTDWQGTDSYPRFSPDGSSIVFFSDRSGPTHIYRVPVAGGMVEQLTRGDGNDYDPVFSPDGKAIYFTGDRDGVMDIFRLDLESRAVRNVTASSAQDIHGSISPDGRRLVFRSDRTGAFEIHLLDLESDEVRRLSYMPGSKRHPSFGVDGRHVVYQSVHGIGYATIHAVSIDGGEEVALRGLSGANLNPSWGRGRGAEVVSQKGQALRCVTPLRALVDAMGDGPRRAVRFLRSIRLFHRVCNFPA